MDALAAHRHRTALRGERLAVHILEMRDSLIAVIFDARAAPAEDHLVGAGACDEGVEQHHLQITAVDGELWHVIAGETPGRLAVDVLTEAVVETIFARGDGDLGERSFQPESA